jgi:hypothetical protein
MLDEKNYDYLNSKYVGSEFGDLRRERAALMKRLVFSNDTTVKPRIREITQQMLEFLRRR